MAESIQGKVHAIEAELNKELESAKKARLTSLVVGIVLFLIVFFVFLNITSKVKSAVSPENLAELAAYAVRQMVKEGRPAAERAFKQNIPVFLKNLKRSFIHDVVPALRKEVERELVKIVEHAFLSSSKSFNDAVRSAVRKAREAAQGQSRTTPEFLAKLIVQEFEKEKEKFYADRASETLGAQYLKSQAMLKGLRQKLEILAGKRRPKTREELLELRFLRAWVSLLSYGEEDQGERLTRGVKIIRKQREKKPARSR